MAAAKVYVEQLRKLKHGHPLYEPEREVHVGDVGFFLEGAFCRLFNVLLPADHPAHQAIGLPPYFAPLEILRHHQDVNANYLGPQALHTQSVEKPTIEVELNAENVIPAGLGMTYKCANSFGAILLLRERMARANLRDTTNVRRYIQQNIDHWYAFARNIGYGEAQLPEGSLVLVRGCDKTTSWALAAFAERSRDASIFFNGGYVSAGGLRVKLSGSWTSSSSAEHRSGPLAETMAHRLIDDDRVSASPFPPECDQCVFVRVWRIRRRVGPLRIPTFIAAAAEPEDLPFHRDDAVAPPLPSGNTSSENEGLNEVSIEMDPPAELDSHALDYVLDYILKKSPVDTAIATDDDLYSLFPSSELPDDIQHEIQVNQPQIYVDCCGLGSLHALETRPTGTEDDLTVKQLSVRKRGRPPGSKNKKTLSKEKAKAAAKVAAATSADEDDGDNPETSTSAQPVPAPPKRKRGRPPASKNKKTLENLPVDGPSQGTAPPFLTPPIHGYASDITGGSRIYAMNHSRAYTGGPAASGLPRAPTEPSAVLPVPAQPHGFNHGSGYYQPSSLMQVDEGTMVAATDTLSTDAFWKDMMLPGFVWPDSPPSMTGSVTETSPRGSTTEGYPAA